MRIANFSWGLVLQIGMGDWGYGIGIGDQDLAFRGGSRIFCGGGQLKKRKNLEKIGKNRQSLEKIGKNL